MHEEYSLCLYIVIECTFTFELLLVKENDFSSGDWTARDTLYFLFCPSFNLPFNNKATVSFYHFMNVFPCL